MEHCEVQQKRKDTPLGLLRFEKCYRMQNCELHDIGMGARWHASNCARNRNAHMQWYLVHSLLPRDVIVGQANTSRY